jgi:hypothetical protein
MLDYWWSSLYCEMGRQYYFGKTIIVCQLHVNIFININWFFVVQTNINGLQGFPGIVSLVPINKAPLGWWDYKGISLLLTWKIFIVFVENFHFSWSILGHAYMIMWLDNRNIATVFVDLDVTIFCCFLFMSECLHHLNKSH